MITTKSNMEIENKLRTLGLELPPAPAPVGSYVPYVITGNLLVTSGAICMQNGAMTHSGKVGEAQTIDTAQEAARICTLNTLAVVKSAIGSLDAVKRIVMLNGFVNAQPGFADSPAVINGASNLFVELYGEVGKHARAAVGVTGLPMDSTVEIQCTFEI